MGTSKYIAYGHFGLWDIMAAIFAAGLSVLLPYDAWYDLTRTCVSRSKVAGNLEREDRLPRLRYCCSRHALRGRIVVVCSKYFGKGVAEDKDWQEQEQRLSWKARGVLH